MSDRTWLSRTADVPERWRGACDYKLEPGESLEQFTRRVAWKLPAKLYGDDPELILEFLIILERDWSMRPDDFWFIGIEGQEPALHPDWEQLEAYLKLSREQLGRRV